MVFVGPGSSLARAAFESEIREQQIAAVIDASALAFQLPDWEMKNWFIPWLGLLKSTDGGAAKSATEANWSRLREQIGAAVHDVSSTEVRNQPAYQPEFTAYYRCDDGNLVLARAASGLGAGRWLLALAIGAVAGAAWRFPERMAPALALIQRWPAAVGIAIGLLWWAYLAPSLLGLAIIALSLAALFKLRQQRQVLREGVVRPLT
jgi:hypothetical protein